MDQDVVPEIITTRLPSVRNIDFSNLREAMSEIRGTSLGAVVADVLVELSMEDGDTRVSIGGFQS